VKAIYAALVMVDMGARLFGDPAMSERMARLVLGLISQRMSRLLYIASEPPEGADAELLRWLQKTEDLFDRLTWRFWGHRVFVWILVSLVFWASSYSFFFEYPRGIRHLCTTMPWTIWPALAVLWGVCWMFIQQQRGGADKGISLLPQQGRHVDTEGMCSLSLSPSQADAQSIKASSLPRDSPVEPSATLNGGRRHRMAWGLEQSLRGPDSIQP
jgi:hypothetical protein